MDKSTDRFSVESKLLVSRTELLDIGLRNGLLNFRESTKSLQIIEELSEEIFAQLYRQGKSMIIVAAPDKTPKCENHTSIETDDTEEMPENLDIEAWTKIFASDTESDKAKRHTDNKLETGLKSVSLLSRLLKIDAEARSHIEEKGANVLYIALGFLQWYEADSAQQPRKAPLVLLPVTLQRSNSGKERFSVQYSGDDLLDNLSLAAKLTTDFGLTLASFVNVDLDAIDMPSINEYFRRVADGVSTQKRWKVLENDVALGFFSFGKFLMFNDLDSKNWPEDKQPADHPVMKRLLGSGFNDEHPALKDDVNLDEKIQPGDITFVKDADSSQTAAIWEARAGNNLIIQGPPGTGKSQTITNIIADLLQQNKTVLFVAEKMAALEVVKRRLDESHLGDAVLELHSEKSTKMTVLKELDRTLSQGEPLVHSTDEDRIALQALRDTLNSYATAVNASGLVSGLSFIEVVGHYMRLKRAHPTLLQLPFAPMAMWSQQVYLEKRQLVEDLSRHVDAMGIPMRNPFWGSALKDFSPTKEGPTAVLLAEARKLLIAVDRTAGELSARLYLSRPATLLGVSVTCETARRAAEAPRLQGLCVSTKDWQLRRETIYELLKAGAGMTQAQAKYSGRLVESAWELDLQEMRQHYANYGGRWWRSLSSKFRASQAQLQGLSKGPLPKKNVDAMAILDGVMDYQQHKKTYDRLETLGAALFGAQWNRHQSDWEALQHVAGWVIKLHDDLGKGEIPAGLLDFFSDYADASDLGDVITSIKTNVDRLQELFKEIVQELVFAPQTAQAMQDMSIDECASRLAAWEEGLPVLNQMTQLNCLSDKLQKAQLDDVLAQIVQIEETNTLLPCFDLSWYTGQVERAYARYPVLQQFDRVYHEHQIERFRSLDVKSLDQAKARLAQGLWERMRHINHPGEMATLRGELNKKRRHIPIRQLMAKAGRAIQQVKPVFMMSPMSIANFLPPGALEFDVVIFDEASQVKAVDAFGAILRGKQVIVVGDTKQMPPTNFFGRDVEIDDEENITADIESILSMFKFTGAQERYLRWHYRSRHESLIAVSNVEFYEQKLMVFPSPGRNADATGLRFHHLPTALYDRGRTRTNKGEAQAVALAVIEHARKRPNHSLGIVAFSVAQRDLILMEVELLTRQHFDLQSFFAVRGNEPFFVKNLENVQGDERDVIYISIGYGRNESGRIAKEFGPINRDGGHRRLNVLITRAKLGMEVFCNFRADDLELDATAVHGVRALKNFLKYAETGELAMSAETGKPADSPFELEVMSSLVEKGYQVEPQIGSAGYFIDIGVKDPDAPGRYLLAIECDGASYHSSRSARDRDRLRQAVLEGLGWHFHRIWSTDWFRNPGRELSRAINAIEAARIPVVIVEPTFVAMDPPLARIREAPVDAINSVGLSAPLYRKAQLPAQGGVLQEEREDTLLGLIELVLVLEAPIHQEELMRRLMDAYKLKRMGVKIESKLDATIVAGAGRKLFHRKGSFVYRDDTSVTTLRSRSELPPTEKRIELVAPEEVDMALTEIIRAGFSMEPNSAVSGALELLGFGRATAKIGGAVNMRIEALLEAGILKREDLRLVLASPEFT